MIVADTNIVVYLYVNSPQTPEILQLLNVDGKWILPPLWRYEFRNALMQYIRHTPISLPDAIMMIQHSEQRFRNRIDSSPASSVMALSAASQCSVYDCEFVALAQKLNVPLLTYDKRVLREFPNIAIKPRDHLDKLEQTLSA